jgi:hypothetical protein
VLDAFAERLRQCDCRRELPGLRGALGEMDRALESIRQSEILYGQPVEAPVHRLELVDHYHATGSAAIKVLPVSSLLLTPPSPKTPIAACLPNQRPFAVDSPR